MPQENVAKFMSDLTQALKNKTFVKMTLGNYRGNDEHLQKVSIRPVETKRGRRLFFLYRYNTRDTAKNFSYKESVDLIGRHLAEGFFSAHLFTTEHDYQLDIGKKGSARLNIAKPTFKAKTEGKHDREKHRLVDPGSFYLHALGITTAEGAIRDKQQDKWRQINKFVEVIAKLFDQPLLKEKRDLSIVDMGSGKGYLTFATYDYFANTRGLNVTVTGVDTRAELVGLCNDIAQTCEFTGLNFAQGTIGEYEVGKVDILIALHACNTATDDALFKGISAGADLIIAAPCCHQEIRPQIKPPAIMKDILKHGVMLERTAETITDGLRSLLLEKSGYSTKLFEFISVQHTPKNNMLVATKLGSSSPAKIFADQIAAVKELYGVKQQRLESLLSTGR